MSYYIFRKIKLSENVFINLLQNFLINVLIILFVIILYVLVTNFDYLSLFNIISLEGNTPQEIATEVSEQISNKKIIVAQTVNSNNVEVYSLQIEKGLFDKISSFSQDFLKTFMQGILPQIGAAAAGGSIGGKALQIASTAKFPWGMRLLATGASAAVGSASVKVGIEIGDSVLAHVNFKEAIAQSRYGNPDVNRIPSPDMTLIRSPIEDGDLISPLEKLLKSQFEINVLLWILIFIILFLMFYILITNKIIYNKSTDIKSNSKKSIFFNIKQKINQILPNKLNDFLSNITLSSNKIFSVSSEINKRFLLGLIIFNSFFLIFLLLLNLYVSYELMTKIDEYIIEYMDLYNKSIMMLISPVKFKFSKDTYINFWQKLVMFSIRFILILLIKILFFSPIIYWAGLEEIENLAEAAFSKDQDHFYLSKDAMNKGLQAGTEVLKAALSEGLSSLGAAGAAGTATGAAIKATAGMPPVQRAALVGGTTFMTAATTSLGLRVGKNLSNNLNININLKDSKNNNNPDIDSIPSPSDNIINSPLEIGDISPLEEILRDMFKLNILLFILFLLFVALTFFKFFSSEVVNTQSKLINKLVPERFKSRWLNLLKKGGSISNKLYLFLFIVNIFNLFLIFSISLYVSFELSTNIKDYVDVYNHIHGISKF